MMAPDANTPRLILPVSVTLQVEGVNDDGTYEVLHEAIDLDVNSALGSLFAQDFMQDNDEVGHMIQLEVTSTLGAKVRYTLLAVAVFVP